MWKSVIFPKTFQLRSTAIEFFCRPVVLFVVRRWLNSRIFMADIAMWDVLQRGGNISELPFGYSDNSSCLLSSAASEWCWWKTEMLSHDMNCTDTLRKQKTALLHICGRFDGAVCVWGCRGTDICPGLQNETHQRRRHSAPQNILCLLSTADGKNRSRFTSDRGGSVCGSTSFCQVMGTLPVLNLV